MKHYSILFLLFILIKTIICNEIDDNGYIMYCPCMGRFGNQADHFLGSLAFAHSLNRTLILPPWVEYRKGETKSIQVPFDTYFEVQSLQRFHKVITMEYFMETLAPNIWPPSKRVSFCYMERKGLDGSSGNGCNAKDGNPFGPFWDTFNVDFYDSTFYEPLNYDVARSPNMLHKWNKKYPADDWPVLCFTGAPASFPIQLENIGLQKHLVWSTKIDKAAHKFIKNSLPKGAFLGIHLRNGIDWVRACEHIKDIKNLFSSAQCLGYRNEKGSISMEMCFPTKEIVVRHLKRQIKKFNEQNPGNEIKSIFVASDSNHMIRELNEALLRMKIKAFKLEENDPHLDLAILGLANHFIGNCVSSYTAFVKRDRDVKGFPSSFWGFPTVKSNKSDKSGMHEEL